MDLGFNHLISLGVAVAALHYSITVMHLDYKLNALLTASLFGV
jgi:hypothetical protein